MALHETPSDLCQVASWFVWHVISCYFWALFFVMAPLFTIETLYNKWCAIIKAPQKTVLKTCGTGHHGLHDCSCLLYLLGTWYDGALSLPIQNSLEYCMLWYKSRDIYCYILSRPDLRLWLRSRTCYSLFWIENPFPLYLQKLMRWPPSLLMLCYFMWCHQLLLVHIC